MPWAHISAGVSPRFLALERKRAQQEVTTADCTYEKCTGCGACQAVGADNELATPRVAAGSNAKPVSDEGEGAARG